METISNRALRLIWLSEEMDRKVAKYEIKRDPKSKKEAEKAIEEIYNFINKNYVLIK